MAENENVPLLPSPGEDPLSLTPEAELHFTRGLLHLRRGEAVMPYSMALREDQTPPGADVLLSLLGFATVATSRALGQTRWIETYRAEMRAALAHLDQAAALAPLFADIHLRRAQVLRYLGENDLARDAARRAVSLAPSNREAAGMARVLDGAEARRLNAAVATESSPVSEATDSPDRPLSWDDVVLPAKTKRELRQMQLLLENPALARSLGVEPPTGLLLYGPPGTGKTTVARVLATQANCSFHATNPAQINQMWVGESEKSVAKLFNEARAATPALVFLDEVDALIPSRAGGMHQYSDKVVNQFLHEMDGLTPSRGVFVVGATNRPDMLDPALLRGGRLSRQIEIPLPDHDARLALLRLHVRRAHLDIAVDLELLALQTEGFSGADLRALVNEAGMQALIRIADRGGPRTLTPADFQTGIENLRR